MTVGLLNCGISVFKMSRPTDF